MTRERSPNRGRPLRIGITGPIGCGKSTVMGWLGERPGVAVIDADVVAREVLEPGEPALDRVVARFGSDLLRADGSLDRAALGRQVFADPAALADLEAIVHPAVRPRILAAMERAAGDGARAVVIEAIRLVEGGLAEMCDEVWLVTCEPDVQRARLVGRGSTEADAKQRISAQAGLAERVRPAATRVIDTSGELSQTGAIVDAAFDALVEASTGHA
jgi:dephospho-CoA kinase